MFEQYHEARLEEPIAAVFAALLRALAVGRWTATTAESDDLVMLPRTGFHYSSRVKGRLRRGQVIECLRPVSIVMLETLQRTPSFVQVRQRWRVQPLPSDDTRLSCDLQASLNRAANLHRGNWEARFDRESRRLLETVRTLLHVDGQARNESRVADDRCAVGAGGASGCGPVNRRARPT